MTNSYEFRGDHAAIFLQKIDGIQYETLVSLEDFERVRDFDGSWYVVWVNESQHYCRGSSKNGVVVYLHRYILDPPEGRPIDHEHHRTLDNRRCEIRIATHSLNRRNRKEPGWVYPVSGGRWQAVSTWTLPPRYLGRFGSKEEALAALTREDRFREIRQAHARLRARKAGVLQ